MDNQNQKKLKLLFLDVDGVLNMGSSQGHFEDSMLKYLKEIVDETNAYIVLSSTWKYNENNRNILQKTLHLNGILKDKKFFSQTPDLRQAGHPYPRQHSHATRAHEILLWLKVNTQDDGSENADDFPLPDKLDLESVKSSPKFNGPSGTWVLESRVAVESFVVVDDINLLEDGCFGKKLEGNFIRTKMETGLTNEKKEEAIRILNNRDFDFLKWRRLTFLPCNNPDCLELEKPSPTEQSQRGRLASNMQKFFDLFRNNK
jgi:hypothetical protein